MSSFLDKTGLTQLWGKIKAYADKSVVSLSADGNKITYTKGNGTSNEIEIDTIKNLVDGSTTGSVRGIGTGTTIGSYAFAEGSNSVANGYASHAEGYSTVAGGTGAHSEGSGLQDNGAGITITGAANATTYTANATGNLAVNYIVGVNSTYAKITAINSGTSFTVDNTLSTTALSNAALKIVQGTAYGMYSHAEGSSCNAVGSASHAEGVFNWSVGDNSHAEGNSTRAFGYVSHAEGQGTEAHGNYSHAEGYGTVAIAEGSHVEGTYNIEDTAEQYVHITGNGLSSGGRSNAHTIDWDGNGWFKGALYVGGTSQTSGASKITPSALVATETTPSINDTINWLYE